MAGEKNGGLFGGLLGGLFAGLGSVYDSYKTAKTSISNTSKTIAAAKAEAELAYQRSIEQWNLQNAYNTPSAQMARFAQGGLNPNLIYGQGSAGNANDKPEYRAAEQNFAGIQAFQPGEGFAGILPVLMSVGTWMQNMRLGEVDIQKKSSETDRTQQLIDYLARANPKLLEGMENKLSLFPFQKSMLDYQSNISRSKLFELEQEFRNQYGEGLFNQMGSAWEPAGGKFSDIGGVKRLKFLQDVSKTKLEEARASWTEFDITNPQQLIMMVLQGVMGMAGSSLKLSAQRGLRQKSRTVSEVENKMKTGRSTIRRRILEKN